MCVQPARRMEHVEINTDLGDDSPLGLKEAEGIWNNIQDIGVMFQKYGMDPQPQPDELTEKEVVDTPETQMNPWAKARFWLDRALVLIKGTYSIDSSDFVRGDMLSDKPDDRFHTAFERTLDTGIRDAMFFFHIQGDTQICATLQKALRAHNRYPLAPLKEPIDYMNTSIFYSTF